MDNSDYQLDYSDDDQSTGRPKFYGTFASSAMGIELSAFLLAESPVCLANFFGCIVSPIV